MNALATVERPAMPEVMEKVLIQGDLAKLSPAERVSYYAEVCQSLGLNPLTQPFAYIALQGKLTLYAKRDATDQLRSLRQVSVNIVAREMTNDVYVVTARASIPDGRCEESIGAVAVAGLKGEALANAYMKAETKAKRRVTLSLVGLGWMDESEATDVTQARRVTVDQETGEIFDGTPDPPALRDPEGKPIPPEKQSERDRLRAKWSQLRTEAQKLGVEVPPFPVGKTNEEVRAEAEAYRQDCLRKVKGQQDPEAGQAELDAEMHAAAAEETGPFADS